jgi:pimeloyl-ACP methyl ester carboxylesterase
MIHALPGMGADHRMYQRQWLTLPNFIAHDWPHYSGEKTLSDVAKTVCDSWGIRDDDVLIGSSLGGMVACEISKIRKISHLFLVGSAVDRDEVNIGFAVTYPLIYLSPLSLMKLIASKIDNNVLKMFSKSEPAFIRQMCTAIFHWEGLGNTSAIVHRIHGRRDWVIPSPRHVDLMLDGGHLIAMTHARQCAEFVLTSI